MCTLDLAHGVVGAAILSVIGMMGNFVIGFRSPMATPLAISGRTSAPK